MDCMVREVAESDTTERLSLFTDYTQVVQVVKNSRASAAASGDTSLIPGSGRLPGVGTGNPLQYSCLENPMDRGDCQPTVHGAARSWTQMSMQSHGVSIHKFNDFLFVGRISAWLLL